VIGRKLLAISDDFKLLGYCDYLSWRHTDKSKREEGMKALSTYCGEFAARCGLDLADRGNVESFNDHFWYDDGEHESNEGQVAQPPVLSGPVLGDQLCSRKQRNDSQGFCAPPRQPALAGRATRG